MVTPEPSTLFVVDGGGSAEVTDVARRPVGTAIFPTSTNVEDVDPLTLLMSAPGSLALSWSDRDQGRWMLRQSLAPAGASAAALSGLALAARLGQAGQSGTLYRAIIPAGQQLMASSKLAGGFIGATTAAGAKGFAGAAIFVPAGAAGLAAAAPVLAVAGLIILSAGLSWAAERDQIRRLEEIKAAVAGIVRELDLERVSRLQGAEQALHQAEATLLDDPSAEVERVVPGFGSAAASIRTARARARTEITRLGGVVDEASAQRHVKQGWLFSPDRLGGKCAEDSRFLLTALECDRALAAHQRLVGLQDTLAKVSSARDLPLPRVIETLRTAMSEDERLRMELRSICYALPRLRLESADAIRTLLAVPDVLGPVVSPLAAVYEEPASVTYRLRRDGGVDLMEERAA